MLRYWTAGESHGKTLLALVDGFPAGVTIDVEPINVDWAGLNAGTKYLGAISHNDGGSLLGLTIVRVDTD